MFTKNLKLDGIEDILNEIKYLEEKHGAGEDQEHKYPKKSGKKTKDFDGDGDVEDNTDEYAGVKDRAIKKATGKKCSKCNEEPCECDEVKEASCGTTGKKTKKMVEGIDFSSVLDELTDEDLLFLTDDLIEEVVAEFFYETLEEGFEIDELETLLIEQVNSELTYLEEAKVTTGHDTEESPESSRPSKLSKIKDAVKKVASGAKNVAKKVAKGAGEVAGSAVAGFKAASASSDDDQKSNVTKAVPSGGSSSGGSSSGGSSATGTNRPGILGRVGAALKSGLKNVVKGVGKVAGKVVKTAKAGYDEGRGKEAPAAAPAAKPVAAKPVAAKPVAAKPVAAKPVAAKKKPNSNLDNLINKIRNEGVHMQEDLREACWKGYEAIGMKKKGGKQVPNCVPKEEYVDIERDLLEEGYTFEQVLEVIAAYEDGFEVIFEEDGVTINETQEILDEDIEFLSDVELLADWLHAEGVIEDEDDFFGLMEELSEEEIEDLYDLVSEATAMAKRGKDETEIRNTIANKTGASGAGKFADKATALADRETYGDTKKKEGREKLARAQRGDFRKTTSSNPGLKGYAHKSNDPAVKAKQDARGNQRARAALTPNERKKLNMGYEMIGNSLEEGGLQVRNYSWKEVMESQAARNNPEKYEADQKKKSAPVRGEKTPMPPRGDKRREDFEKWYSANVR
jgi:hypothetical protein